MVMSCITTVYYSFIVNGNICRDVFPSRGLRQGDPLSPYMFIMIAYALSNLLKKVENESILHDARASLRGPESSHIFITNDCLLFYRAN